LTKFVDLIRPFRHILGKSRIRRIYAEKNRFRIKNHVADPQLQES